MRYSSYFIDAYVFNYSGNSQITYLSGCYLPINYKWNLFQPICCWHTYKIREGKRVEGGVEQKMSEQLEVTCTERNAQSAGEEKQDNWRKRKRKRRSQRGTDSGGLLNLPLTRLVLPEAFVLAAPSVAIVAMGCEEGWEHSSHNNEQK